MTTTNMPERPTMLPELRGARIALRPMHDTDADALLAIYGDPAVMRYTDEDPFPDLNTVHRMLGSVRRLLLEGSSLEWAVVLADGGDMIGTCGLHGFDDEKREAEVGCLLRRTAWGNGYMGDAVRLLMAYAERSLGLRRLKADVAPNNAAAQRLFEKLGYGRERADLWTIDLPTP